MCFLTWHNLRLLTLLRTSKNMQGEAKKPSLRSSSRQPRREDDFDSSFDSFPEPAGKAEFIPKSGGFTGAENKAHQGTSIKSEGFPSSLPSSEGYVDK